MSGAKKKQFSPRKLLECPNLDFWLALEKELPGTIDIRKIDDENFVSTWQELRIPALDSSWQYDLLLKSERGTLYVLVRASRAGETLIIYEAASDHRSQIGAVYDDVCCKKKVFKDKPYEKRYAKNCNSHGRQHVAFSFDSYDSFLKAVSNRATIELSNTITEVTHVPRL
jgi:hypothetical protein